MKAKLFEYNIDDLESLRLIATPPNTADCIGILKFGEHSAQFKQCIEKCFNHKTKNLYFIFHADREKYIDKSPLTICKLLFNQIYLLE